MSTEAEDLSELELELERERELLRIAQLKKEQEGPSVVDATIDRIGDNFGGMGSMATEAVKLFANSGFNPATAATTLGIRASEMPAVDAIDTVGSTAAQIAGGIPGAAIGAMVGVPIVGAGVGAAGGQALYDKVKQLVGASKDIPATQEVGNFVGDSITNTALGPIAKLLGIGINKGNSAIRKPRIDVANPQTAKLVNAAEGLERLSPEEAARIRSSGAVKPAELTALEQTQAMTTKPEGIVEALGGFEKRVDAVYERAGRLATKIEDNGGLIKQKLDELRMEPDVEAAAAKLDDYLHNPDKGITAERSKLVATAEAKNPTTSRISSGEITDLAKELKKRAPTKFLEGSEGAGIELEAIAENYTRLTQDGKTLTLSQLDSRIKSNLAEQRAAEAFDVNPAARAAAGNTSATVPGGRVTALKIENKLLNDILMKRLDDAYGAGDDIGSQAYKQLNREYSTLRPLKDQLDRLANEVRSGTMTKPTSSLQSPQINPGAQMAVSTATGGWRGAANGALRMLGMGQDDVFTRNRAALDINSKRFSGPNNRVGVAADLMDLGQNPADLSTFGAANIVSPSAFEQTGIALTYLPKPALPRDVNISSQSIAEVLTSTLAPEEAQAVMQKLDQAEQSGDESVKAKLYGSILGTFPEVRSEFAPGKTLAASEFDRRIADPNERMAIKSKLSSGVRSGKESSIDAAKFVSSMNADEKFGKVPKTVRAPKTRNAPEFESLGAFDPGFEQ